MADLEWNGNAPGIGREKFYQQSVVGRQSSVVRKGDDAQAKMHPDWVDVSEIRESLADQRPTIRQIEWKC